MIDIAARLSEIEALSIEDKIRLVQAIWDSIAVSQPHHELTADQKVDLDRRMAEMDAFPERAITWDMIKAQVKAR